MPQYFNRFPSILYSLQQGSNPIVVKNIFFRVKILDSILNNALIYYPYYIKEGDTPEIIASKYYKNAELHWIVLYANQIIDPQYQWPLSELSWINYMNNKYGSIGLAQQTVYGYTTTVTKVDSASGDTTVYSFAIDYNTYNTSPGTTFQEINLIDGTTVAITTTNSIVYAYTYELNLNETKKQIQLIDQNYVGQLSKEFNDLTNQASVG